MFDYVLVMAAIVMPVFSVTLWYSVWSRST